MNQKVREKCVLFSGPMIKAILQGRKTQTRRVMSPQPKNLPTDAYCDPYNKNFDHFTFWTGDNRMINSVSGNVKGTCHWRCPQGQPGTRLIVKEATWLFCERKPNGQTKTGRQKWHYVPLRSAPIYYRVDHEKRPTIDVVHPETPNKWMWRYKAARFMPRWAVRIELEMTGLRSEPLANISTSDAISEGLSQQPHSILRCQTFGLPEWEKHLWRMSPIDAYSYLWDSINSERGYGWDANPWVWVIEFQRVK